jgi:hypothetical protein
MQQIVLYHINTKHNDLFRRLTIRTPGYTHTRRFETSFVCILVYMSLKKESSGFRNVVSI